MSPKTKIAVNTVAIILLAVFMVGLTVVNLLGSQIVNKPFSVTADFEASGGVFTNQEVTYRGVLIGRVGVLELTEDGVEIELKIDPDWEGEIPANVTAAVRSKSAVGEQFVNLTPNVATGETLEDGDSIAREDTELPVDFQELLRSLDLVLADVSPEQTRNVVKNLARGLEGRSEEIAEILRALATLSETFADTADEQVRLLDNSTVAGAAFLNSKDAFSDAIKAADEVLAGIGDEPEELRAFFAANDKLAREGIDLLNRHGDNLAAGIRGLADLSTFQLENKEEVIIKSLDYVPQFIQAVEDASVPWRSPDGREFYRIRIGLIYDNVESSWPCKFVLPEGYERFPHERTKRTVRTDLRCKPPEEEDERTVRALTRGLQEWADEHAASLAVVTEEPVTEFSFPSGGDVRNAPVAFVWPLDGAITSYFGMRDGEMHTGIDIGGTTGDLVVAAADGTVAASGADDGGYGNMIVIDHGDGFASVYAHLSSLDVEAGDRVASGMPIGAVGCTGDCTGDHLHFEIRVDGQPVDPLTYLPGGRLFSPGDEQEDEAPEGASPMPTPSPSPTTSFETLLGLGR